MKLLWRSSLAFLLFFFNNNNNNSNDDFPIETDHKIEHNRSFRQEGKELHIIIIIIIIIMIIAIIIINHILFL